MSLIRMNPDHLQAHRRVAVLLQPLAHSNWHRYSTNHAPSPHSRLLVGDTMSSGSKVLAGSIYIPMNFLLVIKYKAGLISGITISCVPVFLGLAQINVTDSQHKGSPTNFVSN